MLFLTQRQSCLKMDNSTRYRISQGITLFKKISAFEMRANFPRQSNCLPTLNSLQTSEQTLGLFQTDYIYPFSKIDQSNSFDISG